MATFPTWLTLGLLLTGSAMAQAPANSDTGSVSPTTTEKAASAEPVPMTPRLWVTGKEFSTRQAPMGGTLDATRVQYLEALMDDMKLKFASLTDTIKAQNEVIRTQEAQLKELDTRIKELRSRLDKVDKGHK